jgi:hypothetical protein
MREKQDEKIQGQEYFEKGKIINLKANLRIKKVTIFEKLKKNILN